MSCKNCKHWIEEVKDTYGECSEVLNASTMSKTLPNPDGCFAYILQPADTEAMLKTGPMFSCVMFDDKDPDRGAREAIQDFLRWCKDTVNGAPK